MSDSSTVGSVLHFFSFSFGEMVGVPARRRKTNQLESWVRREGGLGRRKRGECHRSRVIYGRWWTGIGGEGKVKRVIRRQGSCRIWGR